MSISHLSVRPSRMTPAQSTYDCSIIKAVVYRIAPVYETLTKRELLTILFEQMILSTYLLSTNPNYQSLVDYKNRIRDSYLKYLEEGEIKEDPDSRVHDSDLLLITNYMQGEKLPLSAIEYLSVRYTGKLASKYTNLPNNFTIPYLMISSGAKDYQIDNPAVLCARVIKNEDTTSIRFYTKTYTSLETDTIFDRFDPTTRFVCSLNYNGRTWKDLFDTMRSLYIGKENRYAAESLSQLFKQYQFSGQVSLNMDTRGATRDLLSIFKALYQKYPAFIEKEKGELKDLVSLFHYLKDDRLQYLLEEDPLMVATEDWRSQLDLQFLDGLSLGYGMEASVNPDASEGTSSDSNDEEDKTEETPNQSNDSTDDTDTSGGDGEEEDPFSDGDDFADDNDDSSDDSNEGEGSSSSTDTESDDNEVKPEDVNPLIELIDNETFDEYLDRGTLRNRIKSLINNPPLSLDAGDVDFLKYWMTQWFSRVSVATTREILGDLLGLSQ